MSHIYIDSRAFLLQDVGTMSQIGTKLSPVDPAAPKLIGVGGWLALLIVKLSISAISRGLAGFQQPISLLGSVNIIFAGLACIVAYLLGTKNPKAVLWAKIFLIADAAYYVLEVLDAVTSSSTDPSPLWFKPLGYLIASILWFLYLMKSKRVKNTFSGQPEAVK